MNRKLPPSYSFGNYISNLSMIKRYLENLAFGGFQENPEVITESISGRCNYDKCPIKHIPSNKRILITRDDGRKTAVHFHSSCIEELRNDSRLMSLN